MSINKMYKLKERQDARMDGRRERQAEEERAG